MPTPRAPVPKSNEGAIAALASKSLQRTQMKPHRTRSCVPQSSVSPTSHMRHPSEFSIYPSLPRYPTASPSLTTRSSGTAFGPFICTLLRSRQAPCFIGTLRDRSKGRGHSQQSGTVRKAGAASGPEDAGQRPFGWHKRPQQRAEAMGSEAVHKKVVPCVSVVNVGHSLQPPTAL